MILPGKVRSNFELNRHADTRAAADSRGMLNGQGRPVLARMRFGYADVGRAGCESIAVYNVLRLLDRPRPLPDIIRDMERGGYLRMGGHLGAAPYFEPLLRRYSLRSRIVMPARLRAQERKGAVERYGAYLIVIWNSRFRPLKGLHTFAASRSPDGWEVFNRFNNDETSRHYARLDDMLRGGESPGAFLVIYRVRRLEVRS